MEASPSDSVMKMDGSKEQQENKNWALEETQPKKRWNILTVLVAGVALFSDGYNAQNIGYMETFLSVLYKDALSSAMKARLSNSYLIGEIFGMLFFGVLIDRLGRRTGVVAATAFLIIGVVLAAAAHGNTQVG